MSRNHIIRFGALGQVGQFASVDAVCYPRRSRVIVRSRRGLEIGEVLAESGGLGVGTGPVSSMPDGSILRGMTDEDCLLETRLEQNRCEAYEACVSLLSEKGLPATLVDVEHLFDGQGLYFYFLGDVTPELEACTAQLAETYETKVQFREFTKLLTEGCGPGCGTEQGGQGSGNCETCNGCSVAGACGVSSHG